MGKAVTIRHVASKAGVPVTTVSRAMNASGPVGRATRERVDGLVLMMPGVQPRDVVGSLAVGLPVVILNANAEDLAFDVLSVDNYGGARLAVEHLVKLGHERIAVLAGEESNYDASLRLDAWRDVLAEHGLSAPGEWLLRGDFSQRAGAAAGHRLVDLVHRPGGPTAAFASSDYVAMGAIAVVIAAGLGVPDDLAFASFDDIPISSCFNPPLTTVNVDTHALGTRAAAWLFERMATSEPVVPRHEVLPVRLEVRASSGPPR